MTKRPEALDVSYSGLRHDLMGCVILGGTISSARSSLVSRHTKSVELILGLACMVWRDGYKYSKTAR